jgi:hypothetical protein
MISTASLQARLALTRSQTSGFLATLSLLSIPCRQSVLLLNKTAEHPSPSFLLQLTSHPRPFTSTHRSIQMSRQSRQPEQQHPRGSKDATPRRFTTDSAPPTDPTSTSTSPPPSEPPTDETSSLTSEPPVAPTDHTRIPTRKGGARCHYWHELGRSRQAFLINALHHTRMR